MGYALLWLENLAAALLLAATLLACVGRIRRRWLSRSLGVLAILLPLAAYGCRPRFDRLADRARRADRNLRSIADIRDLLRDRRSMDAVARAAA